ncbi:TonB-dependent receptor, partial [Oleiphilus sp. HI0061]
YLRTNRNQYVATWQGNLPENDSQQKTLGLMFKADYSLDSLRWTFGADLEYTKSSRSYEQTFDYVPSGWGSSVAEGSIYDYDVNYFAVSPYTSAAFSVTDHLTVEAGLRYDSSRFDYTNNLSDGQYASSSYARASSDNDPSFNHLSPKLSFSFRLDDSQNIYVRYANGFRIPQASRLYALTTDNIDFDLDPEVSDTYELGYKLATTNQRLDLSLYYMTIDDSIVRRENIDG